MNYTTAKVREKVTIWFFAFRLKVFLKVKLKLFPYDSYRTY